MESFTAFLTLIMTLIFVAANTFLLTCGRQLSEGPEFQHLQFLRTGLTQRNLKASLLNQS